MRAPDINFCKLQYGRVAISTRSTSSIAAMTVSNRHSAIEALKVSSTQRRAKPPDSGAKQRWENRSRMACTPDHATTAASKR
eukprot:12302121-Alexandrium_andersonii.AAC.1